MEENKNDLNNQNNQNQQQNNYSNQQNYGPQGYNQNGYNNNGYNNQNYYTQQNYGPQGYNQNGNIFNGQPYSPTSKTGIGILCGFLGLIGLIIGLTSYKEGTLERKTFMKAWIITFCVGTSVSIILGIIICICFPDLILLYYGYY